VTFVVLLVVGIVLGNKAKEQGLSFWLYCILVWLLGVIGIIITLLQINNQKKNNQAQMYRQQVFYQNQYNQNPYNNQYNQNPYAQNQYNQPYGQQPYNPNMQNPNVQNNYSAPNYGAAQNASLHTCPNCGNSQKESGFCQVCGSKLN
jgi:hypothetical protein